MKKENLLKNDESSLMGAKDSCKLRPEATTRSDILYLFRLGNLIFIRVRKKSVNFKKSEACGNHVS